MGEPDLIRRLHDHVDEGLALTWFFHLKPQTDGPEIAGC
jgi:hypothetical protein